MDELEAAIYKAACHTCPGFADSVRELKAAGATKDEVVRRVTVQTWANQDVRGVLIAAINVIYRGDAT